jgi:hypothetical protein
MSSSPINITSNRQQQALHEVHDMAGLSPATSVLFFVGTLKSPAFLQFALEIGIKRNKSCFDAPRIDVGSTSAF